MFSKLVCVVLIFGIVFSDEGAENVTSPPRRELELNAEKVASEVASHPSPGKASTKFDFPNWLRPITESVSNFVALTKHPNFGGFQLLSPQQIWEKIHEKGAGLLTGPYASVIGASHSSQTDYPFAYRKTKN